jgi:hypothetical protein
MTQAGALAIEAVIGRVPSTASPVLSAANAGTRREEVFAFMRALASTLPDGWRLRLLPDHRAAIAVDLPFGLPASASGLVSEVALFLLRLGPYLDLIADIDAGLEACAALNAGASA